MRHLKTGRVGLMVFSQTIIICIYKFFINNFVTRYRLETIYYDYYDYYPYVFRIHYPTRKILPNLKQDLIGLSGLLRRLRSKSCFLKSGWAAFERFLD